MQISTEELHTLFHGPFSDLLQGPWKNWRYQYIEHLRVVASADEKTWLTPQFQQRLWDNGAVSSIGPGQSVTLVGAYNDEELSEILRLSRGSLFGLSVEKRGEALQDLFNQILSMVYPRYTPRRPKARLVRLFSAIFPDDMTCLMDAARTFGVQRLLGTQRLPGEFISQNPSLREQIRDVLGAATTLEVSVEHSMFTWFLWQERVDKQDVGALSTQPAHREATAVPPFSLLPPSAQRRGLTYVRGNVELLVAMIREAEQGIDREDLVGVILSEATQLNTSSAGNIISQAMGGLGLIKLEENTYRPTDRGQEMLVAQRPEHVLRGPLIGRVFGMGHLLKIVQREPGKLRPINISQRLKDLVPTWTSTQPGSYIFAWAKIAGLVELSESLGGTLVLTEDGEDYASALPDDFETFWRIQTPQEILDGKEIAKPEISSPSLNLHGSATYGTDQIISEGCFLSRDHVDDALRLLRRKKNLILQGPPGTGKTWLARRLGYALIGARDPDRLTAVQFQPSLSYEDFVRGWRPDGTGGLRLSDGVFMDAVCAARQDLGRTHVLVIEEINRGNPAQILGEMLTLIEDAKRMPEEALRLAYPRTVDERVYVPANLHIIGTMNLADRSLALVDLALRRRFAFVSLGPLLNAAWRDWVAALGCPSSLIDTMAARFRSMNEAIVSDQTLGEQFQVGHSFVTPLAGTVLSEVEWAQWYRGVISTEVAPLLREYWFDRPSESDGQISKLLAGI